MKNSRVSFESLGKGEIMPVGYKEITCHLIFDVECISLGKIVMLLAEI